MGFKLKGEILFSEIASLAGAELIGLDGLCNGVSSLDTAQGGDFCFVTSDVKQLSSGVLYFASSNLIDSNKHKPLSFVKCANPRNSFAEVLCYLHSRNLIEGSKFKSTIPSSCFVGSNVVIEDGVVLGDNCIISHNTVLFSGTVLGSSVQIGPNSSIGANGFGYFQNDDDFWRPFPHLAGVVVEDHVTIGANCTISRGTLVDTRVGFGSKIDNLVHVGHNSNIGKNCIITACVEISGGCVIGDNSWIGPNSSLKEKIKISEKSLVGIGSNVVKDNGKDKVIYGNPAKSKLS